MVLSIFQRKAFGQQFLEGIADITAVTADAQHLYSRCEFVKHLTAGTAGHAILIGIGKYRNTSEFSFALADSLEYGRSFGAVCAAVGRVLDIAAGKDGTVIAFQSCTDSKF